MTNVGRSGDLDTVPCSSEQEFFVDNGKLVVGFLTLQAGRFDVATARQRCPMTGSLSLSAHQL